MYYSFLFCVVFLFVVAFDVACLSGWLEFGTLGWNLVYVAGIRSFLAAAI